MCDVWAFMSDLFSIAPFHSINDVDSVITVLEIGNYLGHVSENLKIMKMQQIES